MRKLKITIESIERWLLAAFIVNFTIFLLLVGVNIFLLVMENMTVHNILIYVLSVSGTGLIAGKLSEL